VVDDGTGVAMTTEAGMTQARPSVVYILPDKMGGMMNIVAGLLAHRRPDAFSYHVVLTHNHQSRDTRMAQPLACDSQTTVDYTLPVENLHAVIRRLAAVIPPGPGVVVAGDLLDLAMLSVTDVGRAVILILHGDHDYYYDLAVKHDRAVHAYVAYSRRMHRRLIECLPHREDSIYYIPYGIPLSPAVRRPVPGPIRLIFAGRLEQGQKGVLDLPEIAQALDQRSVDASWTIVGDGPDGAALRAAWPAPVPVRHLGALSHADALAQLTEHDVFVLPTRAEGLPVALLEAMGCGVVPVVSNIESGVPDVVFPGVNGLLPDVGDVVGFAEAIAGLDHDRVLLERMSAAGRRFVEERFNVRDRAADYQVLYARYPELYKPLAADAVLQYGSRLDQSWIPNPLVRMVRSTLRSRSR
jgi:glycosyltransferase involved in cell wall biosynthesis